MGGCWRARILRKQLAKSEEKTKEHCDQVQRTDREVNKRKNRKIKRTNLFFKMSKKVEKPSIVIRSKSLVPTSCPDHRKDLSRRLGRVAIILPK